MLSAFIEARKKEYSSEKGFTLAEMMVVLLILSILVLLPTSSWLSFIRHQQLNTAIDRVLWVQKRAQSEAKKHKRSWQASFRQQGNFLEFSLHPAHIPPGKLSSQEWQTFPQPILIDNQPNTLGKSETSLLLVNADTNRESRSGTVHRVIFNAQGCPVYKPEDECGQTSLEALGRLTLKHPDLVKSRRCVFISTVLGAMRMGKEQPKHDSSQRFCY